MDCPLNVDSKKHFLIQVLAFIVSEIIPIKDVRGKPSIVNSFRQSPLFARCDPSFQSSGGVLFKNLHFYCAKMVHLPVRQSYHITKIE